MLLPANGSCFIRETLLMRFAAMYVIAKARIDFRHHHILFVFHPQFLEYFSAVSIYVSHVHPFPQKCGDDLPWGDPTEILKKTFIPISTLQILLTRHTTINWSNVIAFPLDVQLIFLHPLVFARINRIVRLDNDLAKYLETLFWEQKKKLCF